MVMYVDSGYVLLSLAEGKGKLWMGKAALHFKPRTKIRVSLTTSRYPTIMFCAISTLNLQMKNSE